MSMFRGYIEGEPLVSIVMPCYNSKDYIHESISSVINQSYSNWELLVIDDASTDNTRDIVCSFDDKRIKLFPLASNSGSPSIPRNIGLTNAQGQYIAFLDADDLWMPDKLSDQIGLMIRDNISFTCSPYIIFGDKESFYNPPKVVRYEQLLYNNSIGCLTAVIERRLLEGLEFPHCGHEDFALWLKVLKRGTVCVSTEIVAASYRKLPGSVSSNKLKVVPYFWNIYRREEGFGVLRSLFCSLRYFINVVFLKY
ncbi:glycosyltransferase family 2 protein [Vibrio cholerae]|nr:glycosyltransferase family 2 protein [Vibrio cholerae]